MIEIDRIIVENWAVHLFKDEGYNHFIDWIVYPGATDETGSAIYRNLEDDDYIEFSEGNCHIKMKGRLCWRGVWEDRYYMVDEEYWYGELKELSDLYSNHIEPYCKEYLRKLNPTINE